MIIGPWGHIMNVPIGELDFGETATIDEKGIHKEWFDRWLNQQPNEVDKWPFLRLFVMGENRCATRISGL